MMQQLGLFSKFKILSRKLVQLDRGRGPLSLKKTFSILRGKILLMPSAMQASCLSDLLYYCFRCGAASDNYTKCLQKLRQQPPDSFLFDTNRVSALENTGENYYDGS
jgi:hypothetical protein